jgi:23S rRNA G2445 N2-methylase RlmL
MKILTSPSSFGQISSKPFDLLEEQGYEVINNPYGRKLTENEVIEYLLEMEKIKKGLIKKEWEDQDDWLQKFFVALGIQLLVMI